MTHDRPQAASLLDHDTLVMQQRTNFNSNDFEILDERGGVIGRVSTGGSALGRFFKGSRELTVHETDGRPLAKVTDPMNFGFDRFEVHLADGSLLANLRKRFTFFTKRVDIEVVNGPVIELHGRLFDYDIQFKIDGNPVAQASRQWAGIGAGLLGHSRYALVFTVPTPPLAKLALIGGMVALDLIREKESRNTAAT